MGSPTQILVRMGTMNRLVLLLVLVIEDKPPNR